MGWDGTGLYRGGLVCSSGPDAAFRQMCYMMDYADRAEVVRFMPLVSQLEAAAHKLMALCTGRGGRWQPGC